MKQAGPEQSLLERLLGAAFLLLLAVLLLRAAIDTLIGIRWPLLIIGGVVAVVTGTVAWFRRGGRGW